MSILVAPVQALSGAVAGTLATFLISLKNVGTLGLALVVVWGNLLHAIACWYNGFGKLPGLAIASLWWWAVLSVGISALVAICGTYQGFLAGYFDLPVFLAVRVGVEGLKTRRPLRHPPRAITDLLRAIWSFVVSAISIVVGLASFWMMMSIAVYVLAVIILSGIDSNSPVKDASEWWGVAIGSVITTLAALAFLIGFLVDRWRQQLPSEGSVDVASVHSSTTIPPTPMQPPMQQSAKTNVEPIGAGKAIRDGRCFIVTPDGVATLIPEAATNETSPDPGLGLKSESEPWSTALVWVVLALIVLVPSAIYVNSLIDDPPYPVGTLVEFVGAEPGGAVDMIGFRDFLDPPTVPVYQVPSVLTLQIDEIRLEFRHSALKPTAFLNDMRNSSRPECSVSNRIVFFIRGPALPSAVSHLLTTDGKAGPRMKKDSCGL